MMKILQKPTATVAQVLNDLEPIVATNPHLRLEYGNDDGNSMFVEGIRLRNGIAILETTGNERRAASVDDLLASFRILAPSVGVVLQDGWELLNFEPDNEGRIFRYDDEDDFCLFTLGHNAQLVTTQQMESELREKCGRDDFSRKLALVTKEPRRACLMNSLRWHYGKLCLCHDKDAESDSITAADLLQAFPTCAEFMVCLNGKYHTVEVDDNGIFFGHKKGDDRYLCFYLGEVVFNPNEEPEL